MNKWKKKIWQILWTRVHGNEKKKVQLQRQINLKKQISLLIDRDTKKPKIENTKHYHITHTKKKKGDKYLRN